MKFFHALQLQLTLDILLPMSNSLNTNTTDNDSLLLSLRDAQLRIIFETTQDAIVISDDQGCYLDVNPAACKLFGVERKQLLGRCTFEFTEPNLQVPHGGQEFRKQELPTQENLLGEFRILRPDGDIRIVEYIARMNFLPHRHLSVIRDITEQKQTQERVTALEKLLQATEVVLPIDHPDQLTTRQKTEAELAYFQKITRYIPGAIYQFTQSADGQVSLPYASEGLKEIYGISPEEVREDASLFLARLHPDDYARTLESITESAAHLTRWYCEYRICRDGEVFWLLGDATPQRDRDGGTTWYGYIRDITDQKAKETDLAELSRQLKKAQEIARLGNWSFEITTQKITWSEEVFRMFGMTPDQGEPTFLEHVQQFHPDDRAFFVERVTEANQGIPQNFDCRILLTTGEVRYINSRIELGWQDGKLVHMFGILIDITDRRLAELELERFFTISLDLLCIADLEGYFRRLNPAWKDTLGYAASELEGVPFLNFIHPDDIDLTLASVSDLAKQRKIPNFINRLRAKDGSYHHIEWRSSLQGELIYASGRDITERIQAQAQIQERERFLSSIYEGVGCLIFTVDLQEDDRFEYTGWSKSCEIALGIPADQVLGKTPQELIPYEGEITYQRYLNCVRSGVQTTYEECLTFNGQEIWWLTTLSPVKDCQDRVYRVLGTTINISDRKQAEQAILQKSQELEIALQDLQDTQMQLIQAEKMSSLGQLVGGIAHEINNPVSFIYGNLTYISEYTDNLLELIDLYQASHPHPSTQITEFIDTIDLDFLIEDMPKTINSMSNGALRIRDIVKSLRTFSQLDEVGLKAVNLHDNLDNTLVILQNRLQRTGGNSAIQVIKNYGNLPLVECYGDLLNQVFMNLIVNAIQAIEERPVKALHPDDRDLITITTSLEPSHLEKSSYVSIVIEDNGVGMSPEIQAQIFNPFFTTKPIGTGTGMGLAICYQIITKNHQGELSCSSTPGEGSKLTIKLPIHAADFQSS